MCENYLTLPTKDLIQLLPTRNLDTICKKANDIGLFKFCSRFASLEERLKRSSICDINSSYNSTYCIVWTGWLNHNGYGEFTITKNTIKKHYRAHVVAYELKYGKVLEGYIVHHKCYNRKCINPDHLEPKTIEENLMDDSSRALAKLNKIKTHCKRGHEFTSKNTRVTKVGTRECRECRRLGLCYNGRYGGKIKNEQK